MLLPLCELLLQEGATGPAVVACLAEQQSQLVVASLVRQLTRRPQLLSTDQTEHRTQVASLLGGSDVIMT